MIKHVIKGVVNKGTTVKRENMVIYEMLGARITPYHGKFLKADYAPPGNYLCYGLVGFGAQLCPRR